MAAVFTALNGAEQTHLANSVQRTLAREREGGRERAREREEKRREEKRREEKRGRSSESKNVR